MLKVELVTKSGKFFAVQLNQSQRNAEEMRSSADLFDRLRYLSKDSQPNCVYFRLVIILNYLAQFLTSNEYS